MNTSEPVFVGIDVSKATLDVAEVTGPIQRFENNPIGVEQLREYLIARPVGLIVVEATGGYERDCCGRTRHRRASGGRQSIRDRPASLRAVPVSWPRPIGGCADAGAMGGSVAPLAEAGAAAAGAAGHGLGAIASVGDPPSSIGRDAHRRKQSPERSARQRQQKYRGRLRRLWIDQLAAIETDLDCHIDRHHHVARDLLDSVKGVGPQTCWLPFSPTCRAGQDSASTAEYFGGPGADELRFRPLSRSTAHLGWKASSPQRAVHGRTQRDPLQPRTQNLLYPLGRRRQTQRSL